MIRQLHTQWRFRYFLGLGLNRQLNKLSSCRWFETLWCLCDCNAWVIYSLLPFILSCIHNETISWESFPNFRNGMVGSHDTVMCHYNTVQYDRATMTKENTGRGSNFKDTHIFFTQYKLHVIKAGPYRMILCQWTKIKRLVVSLLCYKSW